MDFKALIHTIIDHKRIANPTTGLKLFLYYLFESL